MKKLFLLVVLIFTYQFAAFSQTFPAGFQTSDIGTGWDQPAGSLFSSDGQQIFVWEKSGKVFVCNRDGSGTYIKQTTPVVNISEEVGDWRDHGLLGFAIDPSFPSNGYIYLLYVVDRHYLMNYGSQSYNPATNEYYKATISRVTRFKTTHNGGNLIADPSSRLVLIGETPSTGIPLLYESHGIGSLLFADDGTLLVTSGDGASYSSVDVGSAAETYYQQALTDGIIRPEENVGAFRSQMINSLNGKILRINPENGNGIPSNPFYLPGSPRAAQSRVWAYGFRNPYRIALKPGTGSTNPAAGDIGELYVGDVGFNTWEELDIIDEPGVNCGWPLFEGLTSTSGYSTANTLNRDEPNPLYNGTSCTQQYFMFRSLLKQATADGIKTVYNPCDPSKEIGTGNRYFHYRPSIDWRHQQNQARVGIFNGNNAAVATIGTPASGVTGSPFPGNCAVAGCWYNGTSFPSNYQNTFFMADYGGKWLKSFSVDYTTKIKKVQNFGSGFIAIASVSLNPIDGSLVFVDIGAGKVQAIKYGGNQLPVVVMSSDKTYGPSVLNVSFKGSDSHDPDGSIASYSWNFGDGETSTATDPSHNFTAAGPKKFVVKLKITDDKGGSTTDSMIISVNNTPPTVNITSPIKNSKYKLGSDTLYSCSADVSDNEQGSNQLFYTWQTFLHHNNHVHPDPVDNNKSTSTLISRIGCNGEDYYWEIKLTVTDAAGLSASDSSMIYPDCSTESPLPVRLSSFSITQQGGINLVKWITEQEQSLDYYEVERSVDGINYVPINRQQARNLVSRNEYNFADNGFTQEINYYRLKIVDIDTKVSYSIVVKVGTGQQQTGLRLAPNPAKDNIAVIFSSPENRSITIIVRDIYGRIVRTVQGTANRGYNLVYINGFGKESRGIYFVSLQLGDVLLQEKFVKAE